MIRIDRGVEPDVLPPVRRKALAKATLAWASGKAIDFDGYQCIQDTLFERQNRKCAWCERTPGRENQPAEHLRPKGGADDGDVVTRTVTHTDDDHYWWLAWTWSNLLFSCSRCNGNGRNTKGNWFPLVPGSPRATLPTRGHPRDLPASLIAGERPLLLDPARDNPMDAIVWQPLDPSKPWDDLKWLPCGTDSEQRGFTTIKVLELDGDHADDVSNDIRTHLTPKIKRLERAIPTVDAAEVGVVMDEVEKLFASTQPFLAARYDAWVWFRAHPRLCGIDALTQRRIAPPGALADTTVDLPLPSDEPEVERLSDRLALRLRAEDFRNVLDAVLSLGAEGIDDAITVARLARYKTLSHVEHAVTQRSALLGALTLGVETDEAIIIKACGTDCVTVLTAMERAVLVERHTKETTTLWRRLK